MTVFGSLPTDEIERRRTASRSAMAERDRAEFDAWYQEQCDRLYWQTGPCCAGCDHWRSDMGNLGHCTAAGIVSGTQVMASLGVSFCSYTPPPGFPLTRAEFHCGKFKDEFDWQTLPPEYLKKIGARPREHPMNEPGTNAPSGGETGADH